jgi:hypothetical protein
MFAIKSCVLNVQSGGLLYFNLVLRPSRKNRAKVRTFVRNHFHHTIFLSGQMKFFKKTASGQIGVVSFRQAPFRAFFFQKILQARLSGDRTTSNTLLKLGRRELKLGDSSDFCVLYRPNLP